VDFSATLPWLVSAQLCGNLHKPTKTFSVIIENYVCFGKSFGYSRKFIVFYGKVSVMIETFVYLWKSFGYDRTNGKY
jgi:hypothetical protein